MMDTELLMTSTNAPEPQQSSKSKGGRYPKLYLKCRGRPKTLRPIKPPKTKVSKTIPLIRKWKPKLQRLVVGRPRKHPQTDENKRLRGRPKKYSTEDRENHEEKIAEAMLSSQYKLYENRNRYPKPVVVRTLPRNQPNRGCKKLPHVPSSDTNDHEHIEGISREMATDSENDQTDSIFSDYSDLYEEIVEHDDCDDTPLDLDPSPDIVVVESSRELDSSNSAEHQKGNDCDDDNEDDYDANDHEEEEKHSSEDGNLDSDVATSNVLEAGISDIENIDHDEHQHIQSHSPYSSEIHHEHLYLNTEAIKEHRITLSEKELQDPSREDSDEVLQEVNGGNEEGLVQEDKQVDCEDSDTDSDEEVPTPGYEKPSNQTVGSTKCKKSVRKYYMQKSATPQKYGKDNGSTKPKKKKFIVPYYNDFAPYQLRSRLNHQ